MEPPSVPLKRAILLGMLAAIGGRLVWATLLVVINGIRTRFVIPAAGFIGWPTVPFLVVFGALFGVVFLRRTSFYWGRLVVVVILASTMALLSRVAWDQHRDEQWKTHVLAVEVERGTTTEQEIVRLLGQPTRVVTALRLGESMCPGHVARRLEYTSPSGKAARVLDLDAQGRLLCESWSFTHW